MSKRRDHTRLPARFRTDVGPRGLAIFAGALAALGIALTSQGQSEAYTDEAYASEAGGEAAGRAGSDNRAEPLAREGGVEAAGQAGSGRAANPRGAAFRARATERLAEAFWSGDRLAIERAGWELGAAGLAELFRSDERRRVLSALAAAPHADDAYILLGDLARMAASPDRPRAIAAARASASIASDLDRRTARLFEIPKGVLENFAESWRAVAADTSLDADVRVGALETLGGLASARGDPEAGFRIEAMAADADAEVRRAAFELAARPLSDRAVALAAERASADPDPGAALAALQALCGDLAFGADADARLEALGDGGRSRLRDLLADPAPEDAAAAIDAALCAEADEADESARALASFRDALEAPTREVLDARLQMRRGGGE